MKRIVFTGGGTGGHIFPGLAVVDELRSVTDCDIAWIGSSRGIDRRLVEDHGIRFYGIPSGKLRRYFSLKNLTDIVRLVGGFFSAFFLLLKLKPTLVFSKGGFVSVPPCVAARVLRIPVITDECDFSPGLATRINARFADEIFVSYDATRDAFAENIRSRVTVTGNPVRPAFYSASAERGRRFIGFEGDGTPIVLVLGGSLGARQINDLVAKSVDRLCERFIVVHQTGSGNVEQMASARPGPVPGRYKPYAFIRDEMPDVLAAATLVIARSGANTVWECAASGKPMVLVPLEKGSSRGDQVENAQFFVSKGAAVMISGADATSEHLVDAVFGIVGNAKLVSDMANNAAALGSSRPAAMVAGLLARRLETGAGGAR
jgi:UDP-N-acetylglucosamine--N-acetylmuramyl-(pentapeptide) pyrophosphoryl-undecaprenol N-acetylglucosamine transferase